VIDISDATIIGGAFGTTRQVTSGLISTTMVQ